MTEVVRRTTHSATVPDGPDVLRLLRDRIDLRKVGFTDRGSRLVLLREEHGLAVRLAEPRLGERQPGDTHRLASAVRALQPTDAEGRPLPFAVSTQPHLLALRTTHGDFQIAFSDPETIVVRLPSGGGGLQCEITGAHHALPLGGAFAASRTVTYASNVPLGEHLVRDPATGTQRVTWIADAAAAPAVSLAISPAPVVLSAPDPIATLEAAEQRWRDWFAAAPPVSRTYQETYYYAWWLMAANLVSPRGHLKREGMLPSKTKYIGVWHWDALFHALAYSHVDLDLATEQFRLLLDYQQEDGMLPDVVHDGGVIVCDEGQDRCPVTKPPLMAWAALKLYASGAGRAFLAELYEPLVRWTEWWFSQRNDEDGDGIPQYNHIWSSGLDDSPMWDGGMPVESPDLSSYLCVQLQSLARIALLLGRREEAFTWHTRASALARLLIRHFYDPVAGVFWAQRDHQPISAVTPFNFLPLWTGNLNARQVAASVHHLTAPHEFWTPYPVPTVARSDKAFDPNRMWRGPTWINANYLLVAALRRAGQFQLAALLTDQTLAMIARHSDIAEYYNPETGAVPDDAASGFGWSAALFIDLLLRREAEAAATICSYSRS